MKKIDRAPVKQSRETTEEGISTRRNFLAGALVAAGILLKPTKTATQNSAEPVLQKKIAKTPPQEELVLEKIPERSWRLEHDEGVIRVWHPEHTGELDSIVVYAPGDSTTPDMLWNNYDIKDQFRESRKKALFVIPEAEWQAYRYYAIPGDHPNNHIKWKNNLKGLIQFVKDETGVDAKRQITLIGQSAGYRSVANWLNCDISRDVKRIIMLDSLFDYYKRYGRFYKWLEKEGNRIVIISAKGEDGKMTTKKESSLFVSHYKEKDKEIFGQVPESSDGRLLELLKNPKKVVYIESQYEHSPIISSGKVIPLALQLTNAEQVK